MLKEYALLGHPLGHSMSQEYFTTKFQAEGIAARYVNLDIPRLSLLKQTLLRHPHLQGFNVTSPYKIAILDKMDHIEQEAQYIGAVNTVVVVKQSFFKKKLLGFNTDCEGFSESIKPLLQNHHTRALILGTGGAARAVNRAFRKMGIDTDWVSRSKQIEGSLCYEELTPEVIANHKIVVNATPLGMHPNIFAAPSIPYEAITPDHLCYDLIYSPEETLFLSQCKARGAVIKNGADMLVIQAEESWRIWQSYSGKA